MTAPTSPLTGGVCELYDRLDVETIVANYARDYALDVRNYFSSLEAVEVWRCALSGYKFYHPAHIFADVFFYQALAAKTAYYRVDKWEHAESLKLIEPGMSCLEVGCGDGSFLARLEASGALVTGLDLDEHAVATARAKGHRAFAEPIEEHAKTNSQYDVVCLYQVLEHIHPVREFLTDCLRCVRPGGLLLVGVPNNNPYLFRIDRYHTLNLPPHHAGLWNASALQFLAELFLIRAEQVLTEPLVEWEYNAQLHLEKYLKAPPALRATILGVLRHLPGAVAARTCSLLPGRNLLGVFRSGPDASRNGT